MTERKNRLKKFFKSVAVSDTGDGFSVLLDERPIKTRSGNLLLAPTAALSEAIAAEWRDQGDFIEPKSAPLTSLLSAAIDGGKEGAQQSLDDVLDYLNTDLLCYRAESPQALIHRQEDCWDPYLDWVRQEFGVELATTSGVIAVEQPARLCETLREALAQEAPHTLFALRIATTITGSAILALSLWKDAFAPDAIFEASRLDERFQEEKWGADAEAKAREETMKYELLKTAAFLRLS